MFRIFCAPYMPEDMINKSLSQERDLPFHKNKKQLKGKKNFKGCLFNKYLLSYNYMPGTWTDAGNNLASYSFLFIYLFFLLQ